MSGKTPSNEKTMIEKYAEVYTSEELAELMKVHEYFATHKADHEAHIIEWNSFIQKLRNSLSEDPASSTGKKLALEWIDLFNKVWAKAYQAYPKAGEINQNKHDEWVKAGLHEYLWGKGTYEWLLDAFHAHQLPRP